MAGTWMWWITKGFSVWMVMTVSESQTRAVYAIRFFWFNQCWEYVGAVRQRSANWLHPAQTKRKEGCMLYRFRTFHIISAAAIHTKTPPSPPALLISEYTSHVSTTRGSERLSQPFSTRSCCHMDSVKGPCCHSTSNMTLGHLFNDTGNWDKSRPHTRVLL